MCVRARVCNGMGSRCSLKSIHSSGSLHSSLERRARVASTLLSCVKKPALGARVDAQDPRHATPGCARLCHHTLPFKVQPPRSTCQQRTHARAHAAKRHKVTLGSFCVPDEPSFFGLPLFCHTSVFPPLLPSFRTGRPSSRSLTPSPPLFSRRSGAGSVERVLPKPLHVRPASRL